MNVPTDIDDLEQARRFAPRTVCDGCAQRGTLSAYETRKEGPNQGRLFVKCRHCGYFGWLTPARTPDADLERVRAAARPCPKCGKGRQARRVSKDGPNKGRLFLACDDPACDSFEWASPPRGPRPDAPPPPAPAARTGDGFLAAIRDDPDDDATRLIYADWLEEQDEAARAELIRVQVERDRLPPADPAWARLDARAQAILGEHEAAWTAALRPLVVGWKYEFVRGLIDEVELDAAQFAGHADAVLAAAPTAALRVHVDGWQGVQTLVRCKQLSQVRRLVLLSPLPSRSLGLDRLGRAGARVLAESPNIANLKSLSLAGHSLGQPGVQALAGSRYLKNLESLDLTDNNLAGSAVPILASSPNLPRLRRLVLANNRLTDSDARSLAQAPHFPELRELDLSGNGITREGASALRQSPMRAKLRLLAV